MTPAFQVTADGKDITAAIQSGLLSLTLTDNLSVVADTLAIRIADKDRSLIVPDPDTILKVSLGYVGSLRMMGTYMVDEVEWEDEGAPAITISAKSAVYSDEGSPAEYAAMQTKKSRSWANGTRLADIAAKIASEHSMTAWVGKSLASVVFPQLDQTDESDPHFLQRIVSQVGGFVKIAHKQICIGTRADVTSAAAANSATPSALTIEPGGYTRIKWRSRKRQWFRRVVAVWRDVAAAVDREVVVGDTGDGLPEERIKGTFADADSAAAAATATYQRAIRAGKGIEVTLPAPADMAPSADLPVTIAGVGAKVDGKWYPTAVVWTLSRSGLTVTIRCESADAGTAENGES